MDVTFSQRGFGCPNNIIRFGNQSVNDVINISQDVTTASSFSLLSAPDGVVSRSINRVAIAYKHPARDTGQAPQALDNLDQPPGHGAKPVGLIAQLPVRVTQQWGKIA